jgi:hypothetical protein
MIKIEIDGEVRRSFSFPADIQTTINFYGDVSRLVVWLPHITLVKQYNPRQFRMQFHSTELGVYQVNIFCDLEGECDAANKLLRVHPFPGSQPVRSSAGIYGLSAQGYFASQSIFIENQDHTQVDYYLQLKARLPVPSAARLMPSSVLDIVARNIMHRRINEIAEGFIERSVAAYREDDRS